jgi:hypothetical protein
MQDCQVRTLKLCSTVGIGKPAVISIFHNLRHNKVCTQWVPKMLTEEHIEAQKAICMELCQRYENEGDAFVPHTVTVNETWVYYYDPETKRQSMD